MLNWKKIDTVLLDMDGTLLDLNFDNHFWQEFVPQKYAELHALSIHEAKQQLIPLFKSMEGKLEWYCLDYWSSQLNLDIAGLKAEVAELIAVLPHVVDFLSAVRAAGKHVMLVTNAHRGSLAIKMEKTCLHTFFDEIVCSHDLGLPKEHPDFWPIFQARYGFDATTTLFVDDNIAVLNAAKAYGISYLISVSKPDSSRPKREITHYPAIEDFRDLLPVA